MNIHDTSGMEKFRSLYTKYYNLADGVLLVYDISDRKSFEEIQNYFLKEIREKCKNDIKVILLGNKTDLEKDRKISLEEGANFAAVNGFMFMETSCLENKYVADSFETLIELLCRNVIQKYQVFDDNITIDRKKNKKKGNCCR